MPGNDPNDNGAQETVQHADPGTAALQQVQAMQKLMETQMEMMRMQMQQQQQQNTANAAAATAAAAAATNATAPTNNTMATPAMVKNVKVPEGRHDMNPNEFRTFAKDCRDYKKLTSYTDEQIVLQIRMNMDTELKRAVDVNINTAWDAYTVEEAITAVQGLLKNRNKPVVYRKEFDRTTQGQGEDFKTFITKLKAVAADCDFVCPHSKDHCLIEYHLINKIRSGVFDTTLQQELLQKEETLNTLKLISDYCENYESAKTDQEKLASAASAISPIHTDELAGEAWLAAMSAYKRGKKHPETKKPGTCFNCGSDWPHPGGKESCPARGHTCNKCKKPNHFESVCKQRKKEISAMIIGAIHRLNSMSKQKTKSLPKLMVDMTGHNKIDVKTEVVADTGAEVTAGGEEHLTQLGLKVEDLKPPDQELQHAGGKALQILGSYPIKIKHNNEVIDDEIYFAKGIRNIYLSCDSCIGIHLVHKDFPNVNVTETPLQINTNTSSTRESSTTNTGQAKTSSISNKRVLPCAATEENIPEIE